MSRWLPFLGLLVLACRQGLPEPVLPLTPTPDASFRSAPPELGPSVAPSMPELRVERLENGMTVFVSERPELPIVSLIYANRAAREAGEYGSYGLAALTASALNEGTRLPGNVELARMRIGGVAPVIASGFAGTTLAVNAFASAHRTGIELLAHLVRRPLLTDAGIESARTDLAEQAFGRSLQVGVQLRRAAYEALMDRLAARERGVLSGLTDAMVRQFYREHYRPAESALVVVGAVRAADVLSAARAAFGDWTELPRAVRQATGPAASSRVRSTSTIQAFMGDGRQAHFVMASPCVGAHDPDSAAFDVLAMILANLYGSRAMTALRHEDGSGYAVSADCEQREREGVFWLEFAVDTPAAGEALARVLNEIRRLEFEHVTDGELEGAKARALALLDGTFGPNESLGRTVATLYLLGLPLEYLADFRARLAAVDAEAVRRAARRAFRRTRRGLAVYGDPPSLSVALRPYGDITWWTFDDGRPPAGER